MNNSAERRLSQPTNPHGVLTATYQQMLGMCDTLEAIADSLPDHHPRHRCQDVSDRLEALVEATHRLEEDTLFPALVAANRPGLTVTVARLRQEHRADSSAAGEVSEVLRSLASGRAELSRDAVGYLLRAFFDAMRRHVRAELELIALFARPEPLERSDR